MNRFESDQCTFLTYTSSTESTFWAILAIDVKKVFTFFSFLNKKRVFNVFFNFLNVFLLMNNARRCKIRYRNLRRHRAVLSAIARLSCSSSLVVSVHSVVSCHYPNSITTTQQTCFCCCQHCKLLWTC